MRAALSFTVPALALAALAAGYVHDCAGPRPGVVGAWAEPLAGGMRAVASVANAGGEGQIEVDFRLRDRKSGRIYARQETAPVRRGEPAEVSTWIAAPAGDYQVEAEVAYPPR